MNAQQCSISYEEILEYIAYLASSARGVIFEPHDYGSFRLIDAISRFINMLKQLPEFKNNDFLLSINEYIEKEKYKIMYNRDEYLKFLEKLILMVAEEVKKY